MLSYFFHRGLVVTINSDDDTKSRQRAYEIAAERLAPLNETPRLLGHATLPVDGTVVTWDRESETPHKHGEYIENRDPSISTGAFKITR